MQARAFSLVHQSGHFFGSPYEVKGGPSFLCVLRKESERDTLKQKPRHRRIPKREESADWASGLGARKIHPDNLFFEFDPQLGVGAPLHPGALKPLIRTSNLAVQTQPNFG
jgi:hypothetical protein